MREMIVKTDKYRLLMMTILAMTGLLMMCLCGCTNSTGVITLKQEIVYVNVDDTISTSISDYVRASKAMRERMRLDLSRVDTKKIGEYPATVSYDQYVARFSVVVTDLKAPVITLKADTIYLEQSGYLELRDVVAEAYDYSEFYYGFTDDMTLADSKKGMLDELSFSQLGTYDCEIVARDVFDNYSVFSFRVKVVAAPEEVPSDAVQAEDYSAFMNRNPGAALSDLNSYSGTAVDYGVSNEPDGETHRPDLAYYQNLYGSYAVDFIQPDSRYMWLTFNEQYELGYTADLLDTLQEKNVKAVFFVTRVYMEKNPDLIRRMLDEGHVLGNYMANGVSVNNLSVNELTDEIIGLYNYAYENYGYKMYLYRSPSGIFSEQSLAVAQALGYRTVFWSYAYADWSEIQPDVTESLNYAVRCLHGGEIFALSGGSSTNAAMLGDLIDSARAAGYEFAVYQQNR